MTTLRVTRGLQASAALLFATLVSAPASGAPEQFDTAFGSDGTVLLSPPPATALRVRAGPERTWIVTVTVQSDDDPAYAAGVWRLDRAGRPDPTFGDGDGFVHAATYCGSARCTIHEAVVTTDGIVLLVAATGSNVATRVLRLTHDGGLDPRFGMMGEAAAPPGLGDALLTGLAASPDGGVFVAGYTNSVARAPRAWKLDRAGAVAADFGVVALPLVAGAPVMLAVDGAGRLLAATDTSVARVLANGQLDAAFGAAGVSDALAATVSRVRTLVAAPGGAVRVLVQRGGSVDSRPDVRTYVAALREDGALDPAFGTAGFAQVLTDRAGEDVLGEDLALDAAGRLVVAGSAGEFDYLPFSFVMLRVVVARFTADGQPDHHFAPGGSTTFWGGSAAEARAVALADDGGIVVAGAQHDAPGWGGKYPVYRRRPALFALQGGSTPAPRLLHESGVIEYFHAGYGHYFMTANPAEASALDRSDGWSRTGLSFRAWALEPGAAPVCRFWSDQTWAPKSSHFYTPDVDECTKVKANPAWRYEQDAFGLRMPQGTPGTRTCAAGSMPLYRAYNDGRSGAANHRYTVDPAILDAMIAQGWIMEGEATTRVFACVPTT